MKILIKKKVDIAIGNYWSGYWGILETLDWKLRCQALRLSEGRFWGDFFLCEDYMVVSFHFFLTCFFFLATLEKVDQYFRHQLKPPPRLAFDHELFLSESSWRSHSWCHHWIMLNLTHIDKFCFPVSRHLKTSWEMPKIATDLEPALAAASCQQGCVSRWAREFAECSKGKCHGIWFILLSSWDCCLKTFPNFSMRTHNLHFFGGSNL